jgi:sRNA-binding regulator protein Hfq
MEDKYSLEGKLVTIFLHGSWEFTGRVEFFSKEKVVLMSDMGSLVIYKENIVAAMIIDETKAAESFEAESAPGYDNTIRKRNPRPPSLRLQDDDQEQQSHYGSVIPEDMLEGDPDPTPVSFSLSLNDLKKIGAKEGQDGSAKKITGNRG